MTIVEKVKTLLHRRGAYVFCKVYVFYSLQHLQTSFNLRTWNVATSSVVLFPI